MALGLARRGAKALERALPGVTAAVDFSLASVEDAADRRPQRSSGPWMVCCNPPWGSRLGGPLEEEGDLQYKIYKLYKIYEIYRKIKYI